MSIVEKYGKIIQYFNKKLFKSNFINILMKFQFISDIHLESRKKIPIIEKIKDIDNLFLLGDIGIPGTDIYVKFMDWCSKNYKNVFIIYGNHEYYNKNSKKSILIDTMLDRKKYMINFCNNIFF